MVMGNLVPDAVFVIFIAAFLCGRLFFAHLIARSAWVRCCGYAGWLVAGVIFGPMLVFIPYLAFVHWRKKVFAYPPLLAVVSKTQIAAARPDEIAPPSPQSP